MVDKKESIKEYIRKNKTLSGNKIYIKLKKEGKGIRKQNFQAIYRETLGKPEPSKEKIEKSIPIKYRIVKPTLTKEPTLTIKTKIKEGSYGIAEIQDKDTSYWIKYKDKKDFDNQVNIIKTSKGLNGSIIIFHGHREYASFIESEFIKVMDSIGVSF